MEYIATENKICVKCNYPLMNLFEIMNINSNVVTLRFYINKITANVANNEQDCIIITTINVKDLIYTYNTNDEYYDASFDVSKLIDFVKNAKLLNQLNDSHSFMMYINNNRIYFDFNDCMLSYSELLLDGVQTKKIVLDDMQFSYGICNLQLKDLFGFLTLVNKNQSTNYATFYADPNKFQITTSNNNHTIKKTILNTEGQMSILATTTQASVTICDISKMLLFKNLLNFNDCCTILLKDKFPIFLQVNCEFGKINIGFSHVDT